MHAPQPSTLLKLHISQERVYSEPLQQLLQRTSKYTKEYWKLHILFFKMSSYWGVIEGRKTTMNKSWERIVALACFDSFSPGPSFTTFSREILCSVPLPPPLTSTQPFYLQVISSRRIFWNHFLLSSNLSTERTLNPPLIPVYLGMETLYLSYYTP